MTNLTAEEGQRARAATEAALKTLQSSRTSEQNPFVRQDLDILIHEADLSIPREKSAANERPAARSVFQNAGRFMFSGLRTLLDNQNEPATRCARSHAPLRRATPACFPGDAPDDGARAERHGGPPGRYARRNPARAAAWRSRSPSRAGQRADPTSTIEKLFAQVSDQGLARAVRHAEQQLAAYDDFVKTEILPRARTDFRLPPELYAFALEQVGVDIPAGAAREAGARRRSTRSRRRCRRWRRAVAKEQGLPSTDYRDVIRELKKEQLVGDAILPHYQQRLDEIEAIIRASSSSRCRPRRRASGSPARPRAPQTPAPHMRPPRLHRQHRRAGRVRAAAEHSGGARRQGGNAQLDDFTFAGRVVDADRARGAARATSCSSPRWSRAACRLRARSSRSTAPTSRAGASTPRG